MGEPELVDVGIDTGQDSPENRKDGHHHTAVPSRKKQEIHSSQQEGKYFHRMFGPAGKKVSGRHAAKDVAEAVAKQEQADKVRRQPDYTCQIGGPIIENTKDRAVQEQNGKDRGPNHGLFQHSQLFSIRQTPDCRHRRHKEGRRHHDEKRRKGKERHGNGQRNMFRQKITDRNPDDHARRHSDVYFCHRLRRLFHTSHFGCHRKS